jgi:hypothetical protein
MDSIAALAALVAIPAVGYGILLWAAGRKQAARRAFLARMHDELLGLGAEPLEEGFYRRDGRVYAIDADASPLLRRTLSIRLAALAPGEAEFELKRAEHVVGEASPALRDHPFYGRYALTGTAPAPVEAYLLSAPVADTLAATLPGRWGAFSHHFVERVLYANLASHESYDREQLRRDLEALAALCRAPIGQPARPAQVTLRHGFEPEPFPWHWTAEDRRRWAEHLSRACVSAYAGSPFLNAALLRIFRELAGPARLLFVGDTEPPAELGYAYGPESPTGRGRATECPDAVAVVADAFTDGAFCGALLAAPEERLGALRDRFADVPPYERHRRALEALPDVTFYARRLRDDEDSWYSGEYEILSRGLAREQVERAAQAAAREAGAGLVRLDRPFSAKLLKNDRLDMSP